MGNARYFQETLFVKLEHFAEVTHSTPEKVRARLMTFNDEKGTWSGDLAGGEHEGQYWVSATHIRRTPRNGPRSTRRGKSVPPQ
jgi:hypothetical protein